MCVCVRVRESVCVFVCVCYRVYICIHVCKHLTEKHFCVFGQNRAFVKCNVITACLFYISCIETNN